MRSIWKGSISFGLVSIGVKLYTGDRGARRQLPPGAAHATARGSATSASPRPTARRCAYADIAKGYQLPSGETVVLTDDDFADLPLPTARVVDVLQFVPTEQIDPIYFAKSYYLEPEKNAVKPYVLLRDALEPADRSGW